MRRDYQARPTVAPLTEDRLADSWLAQFRIWFADAVAADEIVEPNAMVVATVGPNGAPSARTVLLKATDERGFVFFTNYGSRKASELAANPAVSLVFVWHPMGRQVVVTGTATRVERSETEAYFATRPRESQLGAWASSQSQVVNRTQLDDAYADFERRYPSGTAVPAPPHWGGLLVRPETVEFWQGRSGRLHDRLRFRRQGASWVVERLAP
jgi:pyridoxamine 5'-phosphate oxidase